MKYPPSSSTTVLESNKVCVNEDSIEKEEED